MQTIREIEKDFMQAFNEIGDWLLQYEFLLQIAAELEPYPEEQRDDAHLISGCQSKLWLCYEIRGNRLHIWMDSEALIVKGIVAVAVMMFQDQDVHDVASAGVVYVKETDLRKQISTDRFQGVHKAIIEMQQEAAMAFCHALDS